MLVAIRGRFLQHTHTHTHTRLGSLLPALLLVFSFSVFAPNPAHSATVSVNDTSDALSGGSVVCTLRDAIDSINGGANVAGCSATGAAYGTSDTITVPTGTYIITGAAAEDANASGDLDITKSVIINGNGAANTTIDGGGIDRVFHVVGAYTVFLSAMTIQNGSTSLYGGGIYNKGALTLDAVTVSNNTSTSSSEGGGGIYSLGSAVTIQNGSVISNNTSGAFGGGVYVTSSGDLTITSSTISGNTATGSGWGGGVMCLPCGTVNITDTLFKSNSANGGAGGFYNDSSTTNITGTTVFTDNSTSTQGGGIYHGAGTLNLTGTRFDTSTGANRVAFDGGCIYSNRTLNLTNVTMSGCTAGRMGGGLYVNANTTTIANSSITGNAASGSTFGGGINNIAGTVNVSGTSITGNTTEDCVGTITDNNGNTDSDGTCFPTAPTAPTNVTATAGDAQVTVAWTAVSGATSYNVYYSSTQGSGTAGTAVTGATSGNAVTGLSNGTPYFFTVTAVNAVGESVVSTEKSATPTSAPTAPIVTTDPASNIGQTGATLNGTVNPNGTSTAATFDYGTTAGYGTITGATPSPFSGTTATAVSNTLTGLACGTLYHYKAVGLNNGGETSGGDATFTTTACPAGAGMTYTLDVTVNGSGTGSINGGGINCPGTCSATFAAGTIVTLNGSPASDSSLAWWTGACTDQWAGGPCEITINTDTSAGAYFESDGGGSSGGSGGSSSGGTSGDTGDGGAPSGTPSGSDAPFLTEPADGGTTGTEVTFMYGSGNSNGSTLELFVCENEDFSGCESPSATTRVGSVAALGGMAGLMMFGFAFIGRRRIPYMLVVIALGGGLLLSACGSSSSSSGDTAGTAGTANGAAETTLSLNPGTTYYWKVTSTDSAGNVTTSDTWSFTTGQ